MNPEEILRIFSEKPFRPKRVYMKDGRTFDVYRRDMVFVGRRFLDIAIQAPDYPPGICQSIESLYPLDIERIDTIERVIITNIS